MRLKCAVGCVVLACAAWPCAAPALQVRGDAGRDNLTGTARSDVMRGLGGSDRLSGRGGRDRLFGGRGRDRLYGGSGADALSGGPNGDRLTGGSGADQLRGGTGPDTIRARDGRRDRISCGSGRDRATLDVGDVIIDATATRPQGRCEVVRPRRVLPDASLVAVGDIARCPSGNAAITAALVDQLPGTIAALGDTAYDEGTPAEYANCYEPLWGRHKARTRPAVGNHEYGTPGASGYFAYFGAAAGEPGKGWYSYTLGAWRVISLNSNCAEVGGCHAGSAQERWLRADLTANPAECTVAYLHHPAFSSGNLHGGSPSVKPLLRALHDHDAELFLAGHDHDYERFAPQTTDGVASATGVRQFVVGTGGATLRPFAPQPAPNSEARIAGVYGVLSLKLRPAAYDWRFVAQPGSSASDSGTAGCH
jgi:hypothetical protein